MEEWEIKIGLRAAGYSVASFARENGVSHTHILNVIQGKTKSKAIYEKIKKTAKRVKIIVIDD